MVSGQSAVLHEGQQVQKKSPSWQCACSGEVHMCIRFHQKGQTP